MAVETSRGSASGLSQLPESEEAFDESIESLDQQDAVDPENVDHKAVHAQLLDWIENPNIARDIPKEKLDALGQLVVREYDIDEMSRREWKDEAEKALNFATQKTEPKEYPWPEASNVIFPLITSAALRFGSVAYPAIVPNRSVVKGVVWGTDKGTPVTQDGKPGGAPKLTEAGQPIWLIPPGEKAIRAAKIGDHMSFQLLEEFEYWEEQTDTMLNQLPIVGGAVRKTYRDGDCNASELVGIMKLVWNMGARSFEAAPRHTELLDLYPHEIEEMERDDEKFLPLNYGPGDVSQADAGVDGKPAPDPNDSSAPHKFLEQHRRYDLDGDGYAEPLTVTVHQRSGEVVRIVARYDEKSIQLVDGSKKIKKIEPVSSYTLYRFLPNPKGGSYPCGFGHYLKPLNEAINTSLNQMFDAGHLQIAGGGFIGTALSLHAGPTNFSIGEYKPVNNKGAAIRDSIYTIPWPGPNEVLFQLLGFLVSAAKEVASMQDVLTGDAAMANTPATTMVALIDQGMKVYSAIYKRLYRAMKSELKKLYRLNRLYLVEDTRYKVGDDWLTVTADDYRLGGGVEPVADPSMMTDMQRITRAAMIVERAKNNPLVNPLAAERNLFEAASIPRVDDFLPDKMPPPQPTEEQIKAQAAQTRATQEAQELQFRIQESQSKLGLTRAQELQAYTNAMVNYAKAKATMSDQDIAFMDQQLTAMRLRIEALNTTVKAADVDAKIHGHNLGHAARMAAVGARASEVADGPARPTNTGGGVPAVPTIPEPGNGGDGGGGIPAMAPQPGDSQLPALPGAPPPVPE